MKPQKSVFAHCGEVSRLEESVFCEAFFRFLFVANVSLVNVETLGGEFANFPTVQYIFIFVYNFRFKALHPGLKNEPNNRYVR